MAWKYNNIASTSATLGGGDVNIGRFGTANTVEAASGYDFLSLVLHEIEHSIGFSSGTTRFTDAVDASGTLMSISSALSGLPGSFNVPIAGTHIDGTADNGLFNNTTIALPGFNSGERALLTSVDILAVCQIEGCTSSQYDLDPSATSVSAVPESQSWSMMAAGLVALVGFSRRRTTKQSTLTLAT
jgi:hypothetical protein